MGKEWSIFSFRSKEKIEDQFLNPRRISDQIRSETREKISSFPKNLFSKMQIIGHRGVGSREENTEISFQNAISQFADYIELDLMLTSDHIPVIFHDETLDRMTRRTGRIDSIPYSELKEIRTRQGNKILSFEEFLEIFKNFLTPMGAPIKWNFELKVSGTARAVLPILQKFINKNYYKHENIIFTFFKLSELLTIHELSPSSRLGLLREKINTIELIALSHLDFIETIVLDHAYVTQEIINKIQFLGKDVWVYTVNGLTSIYKVFILGVDGIITDYPALTLETLNSLNNL